MIKRRYKYWFSLSMLLMTTTLSAASDTLSEEVHPFLEFRGSVIDHTSSHSIVAEDETHQKDELFDEFKKTLVTAKALYGQLEPALKSLSDVYKKCNQTKDESTCHDFASKREKIQPLANALTSENHKLKTLMSKLELIVQIQALQVLEEHAVHKISSNIQDTDD